MDFKFVVIGGGLSGCSLALELLMRGEKVLLIHKAEDYTASNIAAGLINPIVPKTIKKTWNIDTIFPLIPIYYHQLEEILGQKIYFEYPCIQVHTHADDLVQWKKKWTDEDMKTIVSEQKSWQEPGIHASLAFSKVNHTARVDVQAMCRSIIEIFQSKNQFLSEKFNFDDFDPENNQYNGIRAEHFVFCEGAGVLSNPYFQQIPHIPVAGDILLCDIHGLEHTDVIYKKQQWLIPDSHGHYFAGSNYHPGSMSAAPNQEDATQILENIQKWCSADIRMIKHLRGVRPTVQDRRPLLGKSLLSSNVHIYNGMGSKGCSLIAWLTPIMADYLIEGKVVPAETNVQRFAPSMH